MKNPQTKKIIFIALFAVDILLTAFLFVLSILLLANMPETTLDIPSKPEFLQFFYKNAWSIPVIIVVPLFLLLALNVLTLFLYVKKTSEKKKVKLNELSADEKEALRRELMKDLAGGAAKEEAKPEPEPEPQAEPAVENEATPESAEISEAGDAPEANVE